MKGKKIFTFNTMFVKILLSVFVVSLIFFGVYSFSFFSLSVSVFFLVLFFILTFLAIVNIERAVAFHIFLVPLININFLISDVRFAEFIFYGWERKGIHFDGVGLVLVNFFFIIHFLKSKLSLPKERVILGFFCLYVFFHFLSFLWNPEYKPFVQLWTIFEQTMYLVYFCAVLTLGRNKNNAILFASCFVGGVTLCCLLTFGNFLLFFLGIIPKFEELVHLFSMSGFSGIGGLSVPGPIPHRHFFSAILLLSIPLTFSVYVSEEFAGKKRWIASGFIQLIAFILCYSKGAMIGIFICFLLIFWKYRSKKSVVSIAALLLSVSIIFPSMFHLSQEKIGIKSFSTWVESSIRDRKYIFFRSLKMVDENLWKGTGVDSFQMHFLHYEQKEMGEKIPKFRKPYGKIRNVSAHNFYLLKLVELGIGGFLAFVLLIFAFIHRLNVNFSSRENLRYLLMPSIQGSLLGLAFFAITEDIFTYSKVMVAFLFCVSFGISLRSFSSEGDFSD